MVAIKATTAGRHTGRHFVRAVVFVAGSPRAPRGLVASEGAVLSAPALAGIGWWGRDRVWGGWGGGESAAVVQLEGDIAREVDPDRLGFLCRKARETTADMLDAVRSIRLGADPQALAQWREERLQRLSGVWGDEPGMDDELGRIYESRLDLRQED